MNRCLVTFILAGALWSVAVAKDPATTRPATTNAFEIGYIDDPAIPESSAIVASRKYPGVYWTLNDSGNPPVLFAIDRDGKTINAFPVRRPNRDWEDLAIDDAGHLYIGEIGNNFGRHNQLAVYKLDEPDPNKPLAKGDSLVVTDTWRLTFPKKPFDCESLFVWGDNAYVVSKLLDGESAGLYSFPITTPAKPARLEKVCDVPIRFPCTAADISPDGKRLVIQSICGPYLFDLPKPGDVSSLDKLEPAHVFYTDIHMEAACFVEEGILATSESRDVYLFRWQDFKDKDSAPTTRVYRSTN